jgi:hypothetical protein
MKHPIKYIVIEDNESTCDPKRHKIEIEQEEEEEDIIDLNNVPTTEIVPRPTSIQHHDKWILYMRWNHFVSFLTIPGAGRGAYTHVEIPASVYLGRYEGRTLTQEEAAVSTSSYMLHQCNIDLNQWEVIDASDPKQSNWLRYVNEANNKEDNNVRITQTGHFVTIQSVPVGSELLVSYGGHYWKK